MVMNGNIAVTAGYVNTDQCESSALYLGVNMIFYTFTVESHKSQLVLH